MFKQTILFGLALGVLMAFNAVWGDEAQKPIPASLDEATTFEEIQAYVDHAFQESRKNMKTKEDQERFLETYSPIAIAGGKKLIALGDIESLERGYGLLTYGLYLSLTKHPENAKQFEAMYEELKQNGKFPDRVNSARFWRFYYQSRFFSEKISQNEWNTIKDEFNVLKEEAKVLAILKQNRYHHASSGPMESVLDLAQKISAHNNTPDFLNDVLEELVRFVVAAQCETVNESLLRGYCRRMVGSPFELWGKTVDGNDFRWADYAGKVVLIDFTSSTCGPCREEMPNVVEQYNKYHDLGLEVVCVGYHDKTDNLKKMIEEDKITFPMISEELSKNDPRGLPSAYYGVHGIPEIFLIGRDGRIIATELHGHVLRDTIEKHFAEKGEAK